MPERRWLRKKGQRFLKGLRPDIRSKLVSFQLQVYSQAVEKTLEV